MRNVMGYLANIYIYIKMKKRKLGKMLKDTVLIQQWGVVTIGVEQVEQSWKTNNRRKWIVFLRASITLLRLYSLAWLFFKNKCTQ